jgi:osmoprotectant transport system permease protein
MAKALPKPNLTAGSLYSQSARLIFQRHRSLIIQPILILILSAGLAITLSRAHLDVIEKVTINKAFIFRAIQDHLILSFASAAVILVVAVPAGILLTRRRYKKFTPIVLILSQHLEFFPSCETRLLAYKRSILLLSNQRWEWA